MNPIDYRGYLADDTFAHLRQCYMALGEKQFLASAVWGAVVLEAFLDQIFIERSVPRPSQDDLNGRIQQLRQFSKNHGTGRLHVPDEIVKRCDDIRNTRNRLVHDTGLTKSTLSQDAEYICAGLEVILNWYRTTRQESDALCNPEAVATACVRVFISSATPMNERQAYYIEVLLGRLRLLGIEPVQLKPTQFERRDPIGYIRRRIETCQGTIVIGLERSHAYFLRDREGSENEREHLHRKYTSGWLHLEAGIAHTLGHEIFVLCQSDICDDGIFDRTWNSYTVVEVASLDENTSGLLEFLDHIRSWMQNLERLDHTPGDPPIKHD